MKKKITMVLAVLFVLGLAGQAFAMKTVSKRQVQLKKQQGWLSRIASYFRRRALTVVNGKVCSKYSDDSGDVVGGVPVTCPADVDGCAIVFYDVENDGSWDKLREEKADPGESVTTSILDEKYEIYECEKDCTVSNEVEKGCGAGPCESHYMYIERDATSHWVEGEEKPCKDETVCKWSSECTTETDSDNDGVPNSEDECPYEYGRGPDGCPEEVDSDNDGVYDTNDDCPNTHGRGPDGCPYEDSDNDGVYDKDDNCPNEYGRGPNGCPEEVDSDNDGVIDSQDQCPHTGDRGNGLKANGCPYEDSDNDNVVDSKDDCPNEYGETSNGCPSTPSDSDGDKVPNSRDDCPNTYGKKANGCPKEDNTLMYLVIGALVLVGGYIAYKKFR